MPRLLALLLFLPLHLASAPASAETKPRLDERAKGVAKKLAKRAADSPLFEKRSKDLAKTLAKRAFQRARRSFVLGPQVGVAPTYSFDGDAGFRGSFGLSLLYFDIPIVPSTETLSSILKERAMDQFKTELKTLVAEGRGATEEERKALAKKVWKEVLDEFMLKLRPKRFEKPKLAVRTGARRLSSKGGSAWELGFTVGVGLGPVYLSAGEAVQVNNGAGLNTDLELAVPMTLSEGLRSPTVEFFLRFSVANTKRDERPDRAMLGARIMLDII